MERRPKKPPGIFQSLVGEKQWCYGAETHDFRDEGLCIMEDFSVTEKWMSSKPNLCIQLFLDLLLDLFIIQQI